MIEKQAVELTAIDYTPYGILYNLSGGGAPTGNVNVSEGDGWKDADTAVPLLDGPGALGCTKSGGVPFDCREMERHGHTQEAQIPAGRAIVFCVAKAGGDAPRAEDVVPMILRPGFVFVLHRQVWHSASHGLEGAAPYYWMARVYANEPTVWAGVSGGPVRVTAPAPSEKQ